MRILHVSDTHGDFPPLPEVGDLIVHSGDMMPNRSRGDLEIEPKYQANWLSHHGERFRDWLAGRPMLLVRGNHDFSPRAQPILRAHGCDVTEITTKLHELGGLRFYGFPYVSYMAGEWVFECTEAELAERTQEIPWGSFDVLIAHSPIAGILDRAHGQHLGNRAIAHALSCVVPRERWPRAYLCGHIHESNGQELLDGMLVSNAATVVQDLRI